jgi:hypothetical protein
MFADLVFTIGNIAMNVGIVPSILKNQPPGWFTCLTATVVLAFFSVGFVTLDLMGSAISVGIGAGLWGIMLIQRVIKCNCSQCT